MTDWPRDGVPALILAAGYGSRLAPVTDHLPKPLLPVGGRTLLDHAIAALDRAYVGPIAVNTHHLADQIAAHLSARLDRDRFAVCHEPEILGTGGALAGARQHLDGDAFFLIHNADVLCDADLGALVADHERSGAEATLLMTDWPAVNSVTVGSGGAVTAIGQDPAPAEGSRRLTYTGIGVFGAEILADIGSGFSSLIDPLERAMAARPGSIRGFAPAGMTWHDLGTLGRWLALQNDEGEQPLGAGSLSRITGHGSDRRFWRLKKGDWSAVAMACPPDDEEFDRFIEVAVFLSDRDLGAPRVLSVSPDEKTLLMEDLGPRSLYDLVRERGWGDDGVRTAYGQAVDRLVALQAATDPARHTCPAAVDRRLDGEALRWETAYFGERFLVGHWGLATTEVAALEDEFDALARAVHRQPTVLIHRDFQSQNLLVASGGVGLVDFQGMRLGPLGYDLASLVFDPYTAMPGDFREILIDRFAAGTGAGADIVREAVRSAGLQRIMQALGAYGYLGHIKGKTEFLAHIPQGVAALRELVDGHSFPGLDVILADRGKNPR